MIEKKSKTRLVVRKEAIYKYPFKDANETLKRKVWERGKPIPGKDPNIWRQDIVGHKMKYSEHGNTNSSVGWQIDHIFPVSRGGKDELRNLQPLYWKNNEIKAGQYPWPRLGVRKKIKI